MEAGGRTGGVEKRGKEAQSARRGARVGWLQREGDEKIEQISALVEKEQQQGQREGTERVM